MKKYNEEPKLGPTENKMPTQMYIKHSDLPGIEEAAPGDRIKLIVEGYVHANRMGDEYSDGEACIDVHKIENAEPVKKENAATMHLDKLKSKLIKKTEENDEEKEKEESESEDSEEEDEKE